MEKVCEFCNTVMPMVYCHADAAYLCLSCDAKVHSANDVSNRHHRALLCDSCRHFPASFQCFDHRMFICRSCDTTLHATTLHRKRSVNSYVGCPSASDFAALCGFQLNDADHSAAHGLKNTATCSISSLSENGSIRQQFKLSFKEQQQEDVSFIWKQIMDLNSLQLTETGDVMIKLSSGKKNDNNNSSMQQQVELPFEEVKEDSSGLPFLQSDSLSFASTNNLFAEPFWQWKNHDQNGQPWAQPIPDLDVCSYVVLKDDFDIPDVDTSFSNFEELFKSDDEKFVQSQNDRNFSCSSTVKHKEASGSSSQMETFRSSTASRGSSESTGTEFIDTGISPLSEVGKENAITSFKEKTKSRRRETKVLLSLRRARSDLKKRAGGLFLKTDCYDSDSAVLVPRSF